MAEQKDVNSSLILDKEANDRYEYVIGVGKKIFTDSALLDSSKSITRSDLDLVSQFHKIVSPVNPDNPWNVTKNEKAIDSSQITDPSTFNNWEEPGGPLEHINLASEAASIVLEELKSHLRPLDEKDEVWVKEAVASIESLDTNHVSAAAALHDEGREVTHLFYTNELIGRRLLQRIGIREDITAVLPDEEVMQVPLDQSMDEYMQNLSAEAIIVRIADEFGKRKGNTDQLFQPSDFDQEEQEKWAETYLKKPYSGRPSDRWGRQHLALHNANAHRYFLAMDKWVQTVSSLDLNDLTNKINSVLSPTLKPLKTS